LDAYFKLQAVTEDSEPQRLHGDINDSGDNDRLTKRKKVAVDTFK